MKDRFLFRAWDNIDEQWLKIPTFLIDVHNGWLTDFVNNGKSIWNRFTLEQCTGLKDKNGKLIYEGDILGYFNNKIAVVWNNEYPSFELIGIDNTRYGKLSQEYVDRFGFGIIGNIHENKEMIQ